MRKFRSLICAAALAAAVFAAVPVQAQTSLFTDEFNNGSLNSTNWSVYGTDRILKRTQFGNSPGFGSEGTTKFARVKLDTYNPDSRYRGTYFRGCEILTKKQFTPGTGGIEVEARIRGTSLPKSIVWAFFTLGERGQWPTTYARDEIDFEHITNQGTNALWLNIWNDAKASDTSSPGETSGTFAGLNWANWTIHKIRWYPTRTEWIINNGAGDVTIRTETNIRPNDPQGIRFNIWASDDTWPLAYDASLQPTSSSSSNKSYYVDVDYVRVRSLGSTSDTTAPTAAINTPTNTYSYRTLASASGTAADSGGSNLASVKVRLFRYSNSQYWNGSSWTSTETENNASGTTNWSYALPALADGRYSLRATARDGAGNAGYSSTIDFYIDTTAPTALINAPVNTWSYINLSQATGTASDAVGIASVKGRLFRYADSRYWNGSSWVTTATDYAASGTTSWSLPLPSLTDGRYYVRVTATDWIGNAGNSATVDFYKDSTAPTVTVTAPIANGTYNSNFTQAKGTASDAVGVARVRCVLMRSNGTFWNGSTWVSAWTELPASGTTSWTFNLPQLAAGQYTLRVVAQDWVGNSTTTAGTIFRVQ